MTKDELVFLIERYGYARREGECLGKTSAEWMVEIRAALEATATGPERDLAEQTVEKLEWLAREWGEATVIKVRVDKPLAPWTEVRVDMNRDKLRHFAGISGGRDFPMITRADALALLREKGAKE